MCSIKLEERTPTKDLTIFHIAYWFVKSSACVCVQHTIDTVNRLTGTKFDTP